MLAGIVDSAIVHGLTATKVCLLIVFGGIELLIGSTIAYNFLGKVELRIRGDDGELYRGVGPIGRTIQFRLSDYDYVAELSERVGRGLYEHQVVLKGARRLAFGAELSADRRYFIAGRLIEEITKRQMSCKQ